MSTERYGALEVNPPYGEPFRQRAGPGQIQQLRRMLDVVRRPVK